MRARSASARASARRRQVRATAVVAGLAALALAFSGCAPETSVAISTPPQVDGPLPDATRAQLEASVTHAMAAAGASGAIVGVWVPWSGTWVTGLGTESSIDATPVDADMVFRIADATRPMTCDVLYRLAADGVVGLDDSVSEYVTGVPDLEGVTLLELCNGTSGIGSYQPTLQAQWLTNPKRVWGARELTSFGLGYSEFTGENSPYRDSDTAYILLGLALERASGKSAAALLDQYVFEPLDMVSSSLPRPAAATPSKTEPVLLGHHSLPGADGVMNCTEPLDITPLSSSIGFTDSGVTSTITDLGRYAQALAAGALAPEGQPDRWAAPLPVSADGPSWLQSTGGAFLAGSLIGQHGTMPGYITAVYSDPGTGMTVAVVLNNSAAGAGLGASLAWELAAIASKAPAASGQTAPEFGLPWTAEQYHEAVTQAAVCPIP
ncbi:MAG TPA: serine hydrolase domain-containing protein [Microbacterium sp.]|uniref:serine hydrolase domain-containing protein n=1 Tax=Microbacterium sp. TaxID=51671 RepID=UPI002CFE4F0D|nr:serine hydrolase domain-containing protein [Microbacterium sp.]HWI32398.1 serine hydrolase domain-containing protein [Microbacterium sp.]